jgi:GT2 family glycosyltransferase
MILVAEQPPQRPGNERIAVVVPTHNRRTTTLRFVARAKTWLGPRDQLIIVDDGSTDGTVDAVPEVAPATVILRGDGSLWWAGATNLGVQYALDHDFDYVLTINDDSIPGEGFLNRLLQTARTRPRAIVGGLIVFMTQPERVWAGGGRVCFWNGKLFQHHFRNTTVADARAGGRVKPVEILPGCGVLVPVTVYRDIGLYDASRFPQYHADSEFTLRARKRGYEVLVDTEAVVANDVKQTARWRGWRAAFLHKGSPAYLPAITGILRYAPHPLAAVIALPTHIGRVVVDRLLRMCGVRPADDQPLPHGDAQVITTRVRS